MRKLPRDFYDRDTITVASELLGKYLVHICSGVERIGRIVEVEAYPGAYDLASHSRKGLTGRTRVMFGPPGYAYVFMIYGLHCCLNAVTEREGHGSAVLLRGLEPVRKVHLPTHGPGLLCRAMQIDRSFNGYDLTGDDLFIADFDDDRRIVIVRRPRIGVEYAGEWAKKRFRFYIKGSRFVSKP